MALAVDLKILASLFCVMVVFTGMKKEDALKLLKKGFVEIKVRTIYEKMRLKKGSKKGETVLAILYSSGKLLLQGNEAQVEKTANFFRGKSEHVGHEKKPIEFNYQIGRVIGSDESLKGDSFGGITVAAVKADDEIRVKLKELGVADSKVLKDKEILLMAKEIRKVCSCSVKTLYPYEYNVAVAEKGMTEVLNQMHAQVAKDLYPGYHIVDKYPGCSVGDLAETKAESKYVEVAAASVLARAAALNQLNHLSKEAGFAVPKGSTHVQWGFKELKERGLDPNQFVKVGFKNVKSFFGL